ncbi:coiled-coil domain-containing protein [Dactylosporangium sp. NPDC051541]|uniref:coiled-coil domain-containing protein n=1 Tax=Dactylosporangium sp. NPDC051541 TaxID=3363977 RepID=UPI00379948FA
MSRSPWLLAALCALAVLVTPGLAAASPKPSPSATAGKGPSATAGKESGVTVDEGPGSIELSERLETANRAFIDAQNSLTASQTRQALVQGQQAELEPQYQRLVAATEMVTVKAYQYGGGLRDAATLLDSPSPGVFADRVSLLELVARRQSAELRQLAGIRATLEANRATIAAEVARQQQQLDVMARQKTAVEQALAAALNRESQPILDPATTNSMKTPLVSAQPAPRRADGQWPEESCGLHDPTTSGCLTPRTVHALEQVKLAGFAHYVSCYRPGGPYEHPKGRACDFAADVKGFGGVATGEAKEYGTELATWLVRNAQALGVMYVIWYRQIWTPAAGWHPYRSGQGDPSSDHTNHVHMSIY